MNQSYNPERYWDEVAKNISSRRDLKLIAGDDEPFYRYKRKRLLEMIDTIDFSGKAILEVGCGPGGNLDYIWSKGVRKITGVDISTQMIALAKQLLKGKAIEVLKINGRDLPFEAGSFDVVFTSTVLQHNTNESHLGKLIQEICRVSRQEVYLFERVESTIKGHESNLGRPVAYYARLFKENGFALQQTRSLPIQASFYACGIIRKLFNSRKRKEGEPLSRISLVLEQLILPVTTLLDKLIPSNRDLTLLKFSRAD